MAGILAFNNSDSEMDELAKEFKNGPNWFDDSDRILTGNIKNFSLSGQWLWLS